MSWDRVGNIAGKPGLSALPVYAYGGSYTLHALSSMTAGHSYIDLAAAELVAGAVTTYGISGSRVNSIVSSLINDGAAAGPALGLPAAVSGAQHPGVSSRPGIFINDSETNDAAHLAGSGSPVPIAISGAGGARYLSGIRGSHRAKLAIQSCETRLENSGFTFGGSWGANTDTSFPAGSGAKWAYTTTSGAYCEKLIPVANIPQSGPLAGKVFLIHWVWDSTVAGNAPFNLTVDGGAPTLITPADWETYATGVYLTAVAVAITLPVDGADHTVRFTTTTGGYFQPDFIACPSVTPNPIFEMQAVKPISTVATPLWNAAQCGIWSQNFAQVDPIIQAVVAEFPHAHFVPCTMTPNGLWSGDGLHPNDRGQWERENDFVVMVRQILEAFMRNRIAQLTADASFTTL